MELINTIIELTVNNHPGVMSHITGLFSRRGYNMEGILCAPIEDGNRSKMYLFVSGQEQIPQVTKQLEKLYDVVTVQVRTDYDQSLFNKLHDFIEKQM